MRVFVAGATGTLGRPTVRLLIAHGHEVVGLTRSHDGRRTIEAIGARGLVGDVLDREGLRSLLMTVRPDQVVHLLTALPPAGALRASQLRPTNDLRTRGTANLLRAAIDAGAHRLVAESFVGVYGSVAFAHPVTEDEPLPPGGGGGFREAVIALRSLEDQLRAARTTHQIDTVALRIGFLYGPDVPSTRLLVREARAGRLFAPRAVTGIGPFVHIDDATAAIVAAIERQSPSFAYNVVDDEPLSLTTFLTLLTRAIEARPPRHLPSWLVSLAAPLVAQLGAARLVLSNVKAKRELAWSLRYPTVRAGLADLARMVSEAA